MGHNAVPAFCKNGTLGSPVNITTANTSSAGGGTIGTDIFLAFTADATNGSLVEYVRFMATSSAAATATTATVGRIFVSTQTSGATTTSNTHLIGEVALASVSAAATTAAVNAVDFPLNLRLPPGYAILVTTHHTPAANTSQKCVVVAGDY